MARTIETVLAHFGVKGMKWGVRKSRETVPVSTKTAPGRKVKTSGGQNHSPSEDAIKAAKIRQQAKKSTTDSLSNKELQDLLQRMDLEQRYNNLNKNNVSAGRKLLRFLAGQTGDKEVNQLQDFANTQYTTRLNKPAGHNKPKIDFAIKAGVAAAKLGSGGGKKK